MDTWRSGRFWFNIYECKRGYARSGTYVCQQKVENRPKKRCPLKAPEKLVERAKNILQAILSMTETTTKTNQRGLFCFFSQKGNRQLILSLGN